MKKVEKTIVPRLPEAARKKLKSGGAHRKKKVYKRKEKHRDRSDPVVFLCANKKGPLGPLKFLFETLRKPPDNEDDEACTDDGWPYCSDNTDEQCDNSISRKRAAFASKFSSQKCTDQKRNAADDRYPCNAREYSGRNKKLEKAHGAPLLVMLNLFKVWHPAMSRTRDYSDTTLNTSSIEVIPYRNCPHIESFISQSFIKALNESCALVPSEWVPISQSSPCAAAQVMTILKRLGRPPR